MKILVLNGPNLNMLGKRKKSHYGAKTLAEIEKELEKVTAKLDVKLVFAQSNHEGGLIDVIQREREKIAGILINGGALSHYGYSLRDALIDAGVPVVTVHLSNIYSRREKFRHKDILSDVAVGGVYGFKEAGYKLGLQALVACIEKRSNDESKG